MQIIKVTTSKNPDRVQRKTLFDTSRLKHRAKEVIDRIGEYNEVIDCKVDYYVGKFINLVG